ncbi:hypothetical protein C8A01DRAFT_35194 [Parachaetomium inaequale]|uniref:Uncharacterized protein n=1 Tax=Parachaetomium inaequale TaxID=2588326 RepID=A0AAN6SSD2_9PEZI|nr:hypothetical protein C8A01DRAFT_35194 [Parachaetomium inaequale]
MSSTHSARSSRSSSPEPPDPMIAVAARLKELAHESQAARIAYPADKTEHHRLFCRAVHNVLSTELALFTFAQIVDGLPTLDVAWDRRIPDISVDDHPIEAHAELCPGVMKRTREIRQQLDLSILTFDPVLISAYSKAVLGSQAFQVRLIELVAVTVHQLGALLFNLDVCMHRGGRPDIDRVTQFEEPPLMPGWVEYPRRSPCIADIVGYWAEDRIFGGVAVFDRPAEARGPQQPPNVYFNSPRRVVTFRYTQLLDEQQQSMVDFFLSENSSEENCPLPVLTDKRNRVRVDFDKAIMHRMIHRDAWECMPPSEEALRLHNKRPQNEFDYPEHRDLLEAVNRQLGIPPPKRHGGAQNGGEIQSIGAQGSVPQDKSRGFTPGDRESQGSGDPTVGDGKDV